MPIEGVLFSPHPSTDPGGGQGGGGAQRHWRMERLAREAAEIAPEVVICITPHGPVFQDGLCVMLGESLSGDFGQFGCPRVRMEYPVDQEITERFMALLDRAGIPYVGMDADKARRYGVRRGLDHGCLVPLYFIGQYRAFRIVHHHRAIALAEMYAAGNSWQSVGGRGCGAAGGDMSHCLDNGPYRHNEREGQNTG